MLRLRVTRPMIAAALAATLCATAGFAVLAPVPQASADTYSDLVNARNQQQTAAEREAQLRSQLSGVSDDLADKIVELDTLTNVTIPAAQAAESTANDEAAKAQSEADALADRLAAAQKDKEDLEAEIARTGEDYDDAHAAVAQMARESLHGSDASDTMSVVTGATTTEEFVNSMQTRDALSRTESNAASDAAVTLNTSMNRSERLKAIEEQITQLKAKADTAAATARTAAADAQAKRSSLEELRSIGEAKRAELESMQDQLESDVAKQAAQTVLLQSKVDSLNSQYEQERWDAANKPSGGDQGGDNPGTTPSNPTTPTNPTTPSDGSQGTSSGDYGNAYAAGQCTWWAYERRRQMGIGTPSYLGNGGDWYVNAPRYGLRVDHNPQVGAGE